MKKLITLALLFNIVLGMFSQTTVQGHPHPIIKSKTKLLNSKSDIQFTMDNIEFWVGKGNNKAALVVEWNDKKNPDALVWGYRWDGEAKGIDMMLAIAKEDPRFFTLIHDNAQYGKAIGGIGYDIDQTGNIGLIFDNDNTKPYYPINGVVITSNYDFDIWTSVDNSNHWQSGWTDNGYWSYWIRDNSSPDFNYSDLGISQRELKDGSWDAWSFNSKALSNTFTAVPQYTKTLTDFSEGFFIVNEDWFGKNNGSINFINNNNDIFYQVYSNANNNETLGTTTQYGTIYGDNFYLVSKKTGSDENQKPGGGRFTVADAKTLKKKVEFNDIGGGDGRSFIGVSDKTGYIGTSSGIYLFDIENLKIGNIIVGSGSESQYGGQIGSMVQVGKYVFAIKQSTGILIIDTKTHTIKTTLEGSFNTIAQSMDGDIWVGANSSLFKINPYTFEKDEVKLPTEATIYGSWGAWNAGSFCASINENIIYWMNNNSFGAAGSKVIKYDIDKNSFDLTFFTLPQQMDENGVGLNFRQINYGAGLRVDPISDNLIITATESGFGSHYLKNWVHVIDKYGVLQNTITLDEHYWFPAMPVFPDNYPPVISSELSDITISKETSIMLRDKVSDKDNLAAAIKKDVQILDKNNIIEVDIIEDNLFIKPLATGNSSIRLSFNSNGKIVTKDISVSVTSMTGIANQPKEEQFVVYPNPFVDHITINNSSSTKISIFSALGTIVKTIQLNEGENRIDLSNISSGIYYLKTNTTTYKILKK